jgi:hypothetical protein
MGKIAKALRHGLATQSKHEYDYRKRRRCTALMCAYAAERSTRIPNSRLDVDSAPAAVMIAVSDGGNGWRRNRRAGLLGRARLCLTGCGSSNRRRNGGRNACDAHFGLLPLMLKINW